LKCPKQPPKVHLSFSKTRDDIEMICLSSARLKFIVLANKWLINNYFYVLLLYTGIFEVTLQCFTNFILISLLVFEHHKLIILGCF